MLIVPGNTMHCITAFICLLILSAETSAQEAYEVQVYSSPTMPVHSTIFELHSNISPTGPKNETNFSHPLHETLEITTGITNNFELGFYLFNRINNGSFQYIGSHIRPRIKVPDSWKWNVGASLSLEAGFVKDPITQKTGWDYEIRPIIDKTMGKNYISLNPAFEGVFSSQEFSFSPNIKYSYLVSPKYALGIEYYGSFGKPFNWEQYEYQTHQLYAVADLFLKPQYEIIFGIGHGITASSDVWNIRLILGQRVHWGKHPKT